MSYYCKVFTVALYRYYAMVQRRPIWRSWTEMELVGRKVILKMKESIHRGGGEEVGL